MSLQNQESSYIQSVSNRWDIALARNVAAVTAGVTPAFDESALYIDAADTLTFITGGGQTVTMTFTGAGFIPIRVTEVTAQTGAANIFRIY